MPTIYRVHFFNELGKLCDLTVVFERYHATGVPDYWDDSLAVNFNPIFLKTKDVGREGSFSSQLLFFPYGEYDQIVISSYSSPTEMLALLKLKLIRRKYALEVDGGLVKNENLLLRLIKRFFIGGANLYFSTGAQSTEYLTFYGARLDRIRTYQFSSLYKKDILDSPTSDDEKALLREKLGITQNQMVLSVGQFIHRKGYDVMLKAYGALGNDVAICIIGGEATQEYLDIVAAQRMKNVYFVSHIDKAALKEYYRAADLFVLPTREDIWGLVINEAMAHGLPVITTDRCVAGMELIEDGCNGYIVKTEDAHQLLEATVKLLSDDHLLKKMAKNNLQKIQGYTFEEMAQRHRDIFEEN